MTTTLPSDLNQAMTVVKYEILKYLRGKKLLVFLGLITLIMVLFTAMPYLLGERAGLPTDAAELMIWYMAFIMILIILAVTLFAADSLASEFEHRTGLLLLPRPIKREVMFAGKFIASYLVSAIMILIFYVSVFVISFAVTGEVTSKGYTSLGMAMLYILAATGLGFLFSAFMARGNTAAILLFACLLMIFPIIDVVFMFADIEPVFSLTYNGDSVYYALTDAETNSDFGFTTYVPKLSSAAPVLAGWAILTTAIAAFKFKRREF